MEKKKTASAPQIAQQNYTPTWRSNGMLRIYTGIVIICSLVLAFAARTVTVYAFDVLLLVILFACAHDIMAAKHARKIEIKKSFIYAYLGCACIVFFVGTVITPMFGVWVHLICQLVVFFVWSLYLFFMYYVDKELIRQVKLKKNKLGKECLKIVRRHWSVVLYPIILIFALFAINHIGTAAPEAVDLGFFGLLLVFVISCFTDTFAYVVGSLFKGPKLLPQKIRYISPKKTISGSIGGIFGGVLGTLVVLYFFTKNSAFNDYMTLKIGDANTVLLVACAVGVLASIITQIGDIYASYIKRKADIKDFGKYLPGHGGAMDRLDGISFNAAFILILMMIIAFLC